MNQKDCLIIIKIIALHKMDKIAHKMHHIQEIKDLTAGQMMKILVVKINYLFPPLMIEILVRFQMELSVSYKINQLAILIKVNYLMILLMQTAVI